MTDDDDRTEEIRRDTRREGPVSGDTDRLSERSGNTPPFGAPSASRQGPPLGREPAGYGQPVQQPPPAYRPVPASAAYSAPVVAVDRGSGGFPAAVVGAVVAALIAVATSYAGYQAALHGVTRDPRTLSGFFVGRLNLTPWPSRGGDDTTAFIACLVIVLVVKLALMLVTTMGTRAGTGGFAIFLGGWMGCVIAGAGAAVAAWAISVPPGTPLGDYVASYVTGGMVWGVLYGWIAALALLIAHAVRRKPAAYRG
jgi:hypothetical protein